MSNYKPLILVVTTLMVFVAAIYINETYFRSKIPSEGSVVCMGGVTYEVLLDSETQKLFLAIETNDDFELILCE